MTIERLGSIDPVGKYKKTEKPEKVTLKESSDSVQLSKEARHTAELQKMAETVKMSPDVRMDRVEEIKAKLKDPNYIDEKVLNVVADRLMDVLGI